MSEEDNNKLNQMVQNYRSQENLKSKQKSYRPESRQVTLINALWDRMTQLYRHKWVSAEGDKMDHLQQLTENFILWCRKTEGLTDEQWRRGFNRIEHDVRIASTAGDESWPPTYAAFLGFCSEPSCGYGGMYKKHRLALPIPEEERQKRKAKGRAEIKAIKSIFDG